jgi:hypothetical protein
VIRDDSHRFRALRQDFAKLGEIDVAYTQEPTVADRWKNAGAYPELHGPLGDA